MMIKSKIPDLVIESNNGPSKGSTAPMVDLGTYEFTDLETGKIIPADLFMNACVEEKHE